jgi:hypothetical protein
METMYLTETVKFSEFPCDGCFDLGAFNEAAGGGSRGRLTMTVGIGFHVSKPSTALEAKGSGGVIELTTDIPKSEIPFLGFDGPVDGASGWWEF